MLEALLLKRFLKSISQLFEEQADDSSDERKSSNLHEAAYWSETDDIDSLLKDGADPNEIDDDDGATPLHDAAPSGNATTVKSLVEGGANIERRDYDGYSPLDIAITSVNTAAINALLQNGADPNSVDDAGDRPLHKAALHNRP